MPRRFNGADTAGTATSDDSDCSIDGDKFKAQSPAFPGMPGSRRRSIVPAIWSKGSHRADAPGWDMTLGSTASQDDLAATPGEQRPSCCEIVSDERLVRKASSGSGFLTELLGRRSVLVTVTI
jgi:hypothetical protein